MGRKGKRKSDERESRFDRTERIYGPGLRPLDDSEIERLMRGPKSPRPPKPGVPGEPAEVVRGGLPTLGKRR